MGWTPERERGGLNVRVDGKEIKQVDGFVYLGGMVTEGGHSEVEVRHRIQAVGRESCWTEQFKKKLKMKVTRACVTPASLYGLEKVALTEQQQQKLQQLGSTNNKNKEGGKKKDE